MSTSHHNLNAQFDRLVDGELSPAEYRELLASLDDQPDGWRRCALAFLEAQALGQELSALRQPVAVSNPRTATEAPASNAPKRAQLPERSGEWSQRTWQSLYFATLAASLVLAFYVGSWTSDWGRPLIAHNAPQPNANPGTPQVEKPLPSPNGIVPGSLAKSNAPAGNVQLVVDGTESQQPVNVPVYSSSQAEQWHRTAKPVLPPHVIEQLQRAGHEVNHRQQYIVIDTDDGNQILMPVDNYQIAPPRRPAY